jgi:hypothetical protein
VIERRLDVALPDLARQFIQQFDAVAVRIADIQAVRHPMLHPPVERDAPALQERELAQPRLAVRQRDGDVADRRGRRGRGRCRQARRFHQRDIMMMQTAAMVAAVKRMVPRNGAPLGRPCSSPTWAKPRTLGPEPVRLLDIANIDDKMIEAGWCDRSICLRCRHGFAPLCFMSLSAKFRAEPWAGSARLSARLSSTVSEPAAQQRLVAEAEKAEQGAGAASLNESSDLPEN